jgi:hypothetical protein
MGVETERIRNFPNPDGMHSTGIGFDLLLWSGGTPEPRDIAGSAGDRRLCALIPLDCLPNEEHRLQQIERPVTVDNSTSRKFAPFVPACVSSAKEISRSLSLAVVPALAILMPVVQAPEPIRIQFG